jgi:SAM-dependent methyltransferase
MSNQSVVEQSGLEVEQEQVVWSIGMYSGETLFDLNPTADALNPVITAQLVTDIPALFVADPFMIKVDQTWHMFFEVMNSETRRGEIGLATSHDGLAWDYQRIVLKEPFHLSYPYVFSVDGDYYMIPESFWAKAVRLYRGDPFPEKWSLVGPILEGAWMDSSIFFHDGRWWMLTCPATSDDDRLDLFYAEKMCGPWRAHQKNPILENDNQIARPGGRVVVVADKPIRFSQACFPQYGMTVRAFEITELTTTTYAERELCKSPILTGGKESWSQSGMHHIDPHQVEGRWLACVDGWRIEEAEHHRSND